MPVHAGEPIIMYMYVPVTFICIHTECISTENMMQFLITRKKWICVIIFPVDLFLYKVNFVIVAYPLLCVSIACSVAY